MLALENLSTGYLASNALLKDVSASLPKGSLTVLLGANGSGKSTLLRTLAGVLAPLSGGVYINGENLAGLRPSKLAKLVSLVYTERSDQAGALTVEQTVALGRQPYTGFFGRLNNEDRHIVNEAIDALDIRPLASRHLATLSDGERQKTMIARALAQQTPVMLLDEPTAFLDVAARLDTMALLHSLAKQKGITVLLSTHDVAPALTAPADYLWLLPGNGSLECGSVTELVSNGRLDALFASRRVYFDAQARDFRLNIHASTCVNNIEENN